MGGGGGGGLGTSSFTPTNKGGVRKKRLSRQRMGTEGCLDGRLLIVSIFDMFIWLHVNLFFPFLKREWGAGSCKQFQAQVGMWCLDFIKS